ncbi:MAG: Crp/Fnr family transcriptional regulator [Nitrospirae bacterium]|nr:Crp/Fnr family transcriptional regulator [Nitrospirota bacterium]
MALKNKLWHLKQIRLFADLPADTLERLDRAAGMKAVKRHQPIYLPGDLGDAVYLLKSGRVKISRLSPEGKELTLAILDPGEIFGEVDALQGALRDEVAEALEDTVLCIVPRSEFEALLQRTPGLALRLTKLIGLRLRRIESRVEDLVFRDVPTRLAHLLLDLARDLGVEDQRGLLLRARFSHRDLANLIGSTRETVSLTLGEFRREGLVETEGRQIVIRNREGLARLAGQGG